MNEFKPGFDYRNVQEVADIYSNERVAVTPMSMGGVMAVRINVAPNDVYIVAWSDELHMFAMSDINAPDSDEVAFTSLENAVKYAIHHTKE